MKKQKFLLKEDSNFSNEVNELENDFNDLLEDLKYLKDDIKDLVGDNFDRFNNNLEKFNDFLIEHDLVDDDKINDQKQRILDIFTELYLIFNFDDKQKKIDSLLEELEKLFVDVIDEIEYSGER